MDAKKTTVTSNVVKSANNIPIMPLKILTAEAREEVAREKDFENQ